MSLTHEELAHVIWEGLLEAEDLVEDGMRSEVSGGSSQETFLTVRLGTQTFYITVRPDETDEFEGEEDW